MPGTFSVLDAGLPAFTGGESTEQKLDALCGYTFLLLENLRYILRNLSPENFNETELRDWVGRNIKAETIVSNTVITNELYSAYGAVADLVVDELRTDYTKAARYLAGNTAAIDFLHIYDENIDFITGTVKLDGSAPLTEQLHHGARYFWWTDASMTQMTSMEETAFPVVVYQYDELVKASFRFADVTEGGVTNKIPQLILGAGYGQPQHPERGRGCLRKNTHSLDLWFTDADGDEQGLYIGEDYTDIVGLRKPVSLDFSAWGDGTQDGAFTETLDGNVENAFTVGFDAQGRPALFTDGAGHETEVVWE